MGRQCPKTPSARVFAGPFKPGRPRLQVTTVPATGVPDIVARFVDCHVFRTTPQGDDEWLVMKRAPHVLMGGAWGMVQGHIEDGEKAYETAYRELQEETGLRPSGFWQASYVNRFYLAERDQILLNPVFCARADHEAAVTLDDEHVDFRWVDCKEAMRRYAWPGQRKSLQICREQFVLHEPRPESSLLRLVRDHPPSGNP